MVYSQPLSTLLTSMTKDSLQASTPLDDAEMAARFQTLLALYTQ